MLEGEQGGPHQPIELIDQVANDGSQALVIRHSGDRGVK